MGQMILPTVRNLRESAHLHRSFPAVVTAGPHFDEVKWGHQNHYVEVFDDVTWGSRAPSSTSVKRILNFTKSNRGKILIHCHAGVSRSTATAIGVALQRGFKPEDAVFGLLEIHPTNRPFAPNERIMEVLADLFDAPELPALADQAFNTGWAVEKGFIVPKAITPEEELEEWDTFDPWEEEVQEDPYTGKILNV
jgi:hypothetical protein